MRVRDLMTQETAESEGVELYLDSRVELVAVDGTDRWYSVEELPGHIVVGNSRDVYTEDPIPECAREASEEEG